MAHAPNIITYSSVVITETVFIALTMSALHDLVKAADGLNIYVTALNREKIWMVQCLELGDNAGKFAIIVRVLYIIKSVGAAFRIDLAQCIQKLRYMSCGAKPDLWIMPEFKQEVKLEYYSYISCYVDDILCIHA